MDRSFIDIANAIVPVAIFLQYSGRLLKFQVNPERIKKVIPSNSNKTQIEGIGEISNPSTPGLATINISSFFWQDRNLIPVSLYIDWLNEWQASKKPAKLIVTKLNYSMYVTCESFEYETRAGEEKDIYYNLQLQEYRKYGAQKLHVSANGKLETDKSKFNFFDWSIGSARKSTTPVLIDIPTPERFSNMKIVMNPYKTKKGDTVVSITKKLRGTTAGWKDLYELNKELLGDLIADGGEIPVDTKLTVPESWLGVRGYSGDYNPVENF